MTYTMTLISQFKTQRGIESDYAAAKALGVTHATISNYRNGVSHADDKTAVMLAEHLGLDKLKTIARINADRAKKPEDRAFWRRIAAAAAVLLVIAISMLAQDATSTEGLYITTTQYALWSLLGLWALGAIVHSRQYGNPLAQRRTQCPRPNA